MVNQQPAAPREREIALVICADNPCRFADEIAEWRTVGGYRLQAEPAQEIHDLHFDTPSQALQAKRIALRIRWLNGKPRITLKGPSQRNAWGGAERAEIEALWSPEALARVTQELGDERIEMASPHPDFDRDPMKMLAKLGFAVIQDRETHRRVRNVLPKDESSNAVLAEMAIDSVVFHFSGQEVRLHEVEIESKSADGITVLESVTQNLLETCGTFLRLSESKLVTGRAIQELMKKGVLQGLLDGENNLKPAAFDRIGEYLELGQG